MKIMKRIEGMVFKDQSELLDKGFFGVTLWALLSAAMFCGTLVAIVWFAVAIFGFALLALIGLGFVVAASVDGLMILWSWVQ